MSARHRIITILNWEKYNPRNDQKQYTWLRIDNRLHQSRKFHGLTAGQKWAFFGLLCQASQSNNETIKFDVNWLAHESAITAEEVDALLKRLAEEDVILIETKTSKNNASSIHTTNETNETNGQKALAFSTPSQPPPASEKKKNYSDEFEQLYREYPKRDGDQKKKKGMTRLKSQIKTPRQMADFEAAVLNYATYCARKRSEDPKWEYVKQWATFCSSDWEDWVDRKTTGNGVKGYTIEDVDREFDARN